MLPTSSLFTIPNVMEMEFACLCVHCDVKGCVQLVKQMKWSVEICLYEAAIHSMHSGTGISRVGNSKSLAIR